jgi:hypothetical protein
VLQFWFILLAIALVAGVSRIVTADRGGFIGESKIDMSVRVLLNSRASAQPALPTDSGSLQSKLLLLSLVVGAYVAMTGAAWSVLSRKKFGSGRDKDHRSVDSADCDECAHLTDVSVSFMPSVISSSAIAPPKKKISLNMAAEIRTYVRTLGARVIRSYQKLKVQLHQAGLNETDAALEFARRHFAVESFDASALPAHIDPVEFCRCVQGPILDRPRKHSFVAPGSFYPHSWMPHGFGTSEGPWTGAHLPGVGKRLASAIIAHFKLDACNVGGVAKAPSAGCAAQRLLQPSLPLPMLLRDVMLTLPLQRSRACCLTLEMLQPTSLRHPSFADDRFHAPAGKSPALLVCLLLQKPSSSAAPFWARHTSALLPEQSSAEEHSCTQWGVLHALSTRPRFTPEHLQQCIDEGILAILVTQVLSSTHSHSTRVASPQAHIFLGVCACPWLVSRIHVQIVPVAGSDTLSCEMENDHELLELDKLLRYTRQNATEGQTRHARQVAVRRLYLPAAKCRSIFGIVLHR